MPSPPHSTIWDVLRTDSNDARTVFLAWEYLRVPYNVALAAVVLVFSGNLWHDVNYIEFLMLATLGANACFCAGIVGEGYLALLGMPRPAARLILFVVGVCLACILSFVSLVAWIHKLI